ncbi:hypothetical protein JCM3766R1_003343 [Sporobolomyces carnicolor]
MPGSRGRASAARRRSLVAIRSSDGAAFPLSHLVDEVDLTKMTTLEQFRHELLSPLLEIPNDCMIVMNDRGIPLTARDVDTFKALLLDDGGGHPRGGGADDDDDGDDHDECDADDDNYKNGHDDDDEDERATKLYVFDREHLDADPEVVADSLRIQEDMVLNEPPLNPEDPLTSHLSLSLHNLATLRALTSSIRHQRSSLSLALSNLHRVNSGTQSSFDLYLETANPMIERFERLLDQWEDNMDSIKKVRVVNGLLVRNTNNGNHSVSTIQGGGGGGGGQHQRESSTGGGGQGSAFRGASGPPAAPEEKQRFLGDYVSGEKMMAVRDGCAKVLGEVRIRTEALQVTLEQVLSKAQVVEADLEATSRDLEDLEACEQDAEHGHLRIEELVHAGESMTDSSLLAQCFEELSVCDAEHRDRIRFLIERKNAMTRYLLLQMQKVSALQSDIASMPSDLGLLDHDLRTRTENFKHLARLEGLIPAYVATVAEVIRRKEYSRLLSSHSTRLSSALEPLTRLELSRRKHYRANFSGKLPWEVRGLQSNLDDLVPEIGFAFDPRGVAGLPDLNRDTLNQLKATFDVLVRDLGPRSDAVDPSDPPDAAAADSRRDPVRDKHDRDHHPLVKARFLLDELVANVDRLIGDFAALTMTNETDSESPSSDARRNFDDRIEALEARLRQTEQANDRLSRELQSERSSHEETVAQLESRCSRAEGAEARERDQNAQSRAATLRLQDEVGKARELAEDERRRRVAREVELDQVTLDLRALEKDVEDKVRVHADALAQAEQSFRDRISEHERDLRAVKTEADLDRAVFERELAEARRLVGDRATEVERAEARNGTLEEIAAGLREQVARWETVCAARADEVASVRHELEDARRDKERAIVDVQRELVKAQRQARQAVAIARKLRDENDSITRALNAPPPPPTAPGAASSSKGSNSVASPELDQVGSDRPEAQGHDAPGPVVAAAAGTRGGLDYASEGADVDMLLEELERISHVALTDAIRNKMDGMTMLTKKWVKEAKAYRERAHRAASGANDKIAFRHFAKGDLALFLPTRNSTVPVWAAFNVSFPHHFLSPTGVIAEQMKTREWIVARITSLSETIVDTKDPSTNPFLLAPGTKFFLLEVEPWSSKESSRSRKHSSDKDKDKSKSTKPPTTVPSLASTRTKSERGGASESAVIVDRPPRPSQQQQQQQEPQASPSIRRTVSEGFPTTLPARHRPAHAIVEVDDESQVATGTGGGGGEPDSLPPSPRARNVGDGDHVDAVASPSGLARALARSNPPTPTLASEPRRDPFAVSTSGAAAAAAASPPRPRSMISSSSNPFEVSSSPMVASPLGRQSTTPPPPSPPPRRRRTDYDPSHSATGASPAFLPSSSSLSTSPGRSTTKPKPSSPRYVTRTSRSSGPSSAVVAGSSSSPNSIPSSSSWSSSSIAVERRRRGSGGGGGGVSPSSLLMSKALATNEAQLNDSRWNLMQDDLDDGSLSGRPSRHHGRSSSSLFDLLRGGGRDVVERTLKPSSDTGAEGEIRKLLGQPQF